MNVTNSRMVNLLEDAMPISNLEQKYLDYKTTQNEYSETNGSAIEIVNESIL